MSNVADTIIRRRSCSLIDPVAPGPDHDTLSDWVRIAITAPNHRFTFPWHFFVVEGPDRERLGDAWAQSAVAAGTVTPERQTAEAQKLQRAPVIIFVGCDSDPNDAVKTRENLCAGAAAVENLLLLAEDAGFAAIWRTGGIMQSDVLYRLFGAGPDLAFVGAIYLGRPDAKWNPVPRRRPPVEQVMQWGLATHIT